MSTKLNFIKLMKFSSDDSVHSIVVLFSKLTPEEFANRLGKYQNGIANQYLADFIVSFKPSQTKYLKTFLLSPEIDGDTITNWCDKNDCDDYNIFAGTVRKHRYTIQTSYAWICEFNNKNDILKFKLTFGDFIYAELRID